MHFRQETIKIVVENSYPIAIAASPPKLLASGQMDIEVIEKTDDQ